MTAAASPIRSGKHPRAAGGFTYVGLIILVAIIGLVGATTLRVGVTMQRAQAERDLLHIGEQFSNALKSYAAASTAGQPRQPATLKELLKDPRFPGTRRHLRKIFVDPMTGKAEWGVLYVAGDRGVLGVYSLSTAKPIKVANFPSRFQAFSGKGKISEWIFTFDGQEPLLPAQAKPGQPGQPTPMTGGTSSGIPAANTPPAGTGTVATPLPEPSEQPEPSAPPVPVDNPPAEPPQAEPEPVESEPVEPAGQPEQQQQQEQQPSD